MMSSSFNNDCALCFFRERVREQAVPDAPDWQLSQSTEVNGVDVNVYERVRPRGDFKNVKMTGKIAECPKDCIRGIYNFEKRKQRERMFEDGVTVEAIDIGETNPFLEVEDKENSGEDSDDILSGIPEARELSPSRFLDLPDSEQQPPLHKFARTTDDTSTFLQTVDTLGIPRDMPIAFLNDPERQHALTHLRQQMMQVSHQECMLCASTFGGASDYRFCPCCASICCSNCVSKRVFEVVSRQTVSVCLHCYRESSRIRQPPELLQDDSNIDESLKGKWWRPDEIGFPDYSDGLKSLKITDINVSTVNDGTVVTEEHDPDAVILSGNVAPLLPGLLDVENVEAGDDSGVKDHLPHEEDDDHAASMFTVDDEHDDVSKSTNGTLTEDNKEQFNSTHMQTCVEAAAPLSMSQPKSARCKKCGESIPRDVESIEKHMDICSGLVDGNATGKIEFCDASLAGISRNASMDKAATRIIYHTARTNSKLYRPREVCALQVCCSIPHTTT